jgi:hypothetical protein
MKNVHLGHPPATGSMLALPLLTESRTAPLEGLEFEVGHGRHRTTRTPTPTSFHRRETTSRWSEPGARDPAPGPRLVRPADQGPDAPFSIALSHQHVLA